MGNITDTSLKWRHILPLLAACTVLPIGNNAIAQATNQSLEEKLAQGLNDTEKQIVDSIAVKMVKAGKISLDFSKADISLKIQQKIYEKAGDLYNSKENYPKATEAYLNAKTVYGTNKVEEMGNKLLDEEDFEGAFNVYKRIDVILAAEKLLNCAVEFSKEKTKMNVAEKLFLTIINSKDINLQQKAKQGLEYIGDNYRSIGMPENAFKLYKSIYDKVEMSSKCLASGDFLEDKGDFVGAEFFYSKAPQFGVSADEKYKELGKIVLGQGKIGEGLRLLSISKKQNPSEILSLYNKGKLEDVISRCGIEKETVLQLGDIYYNLSCYPSALQYYEIAKSADGIMLIADRYKDKGYSTAPCDEKMLDNAISLYVNIFRSNEAPEETRNQAKAKIKELGDFYAMEKKMDKAGPLYKIINAEGLSGLNDLVKQLK